jgi:PRTRC genetic system ThiF family protein
MLFGCGGTGGFVAEGLCRLFTGTKHRIFLVDPDRVEEHNLLRQNFFKPDVGRFKAQALAERLSKQYGREVNYCCLPVEELSVADRAEVNIGCVDNARAREILQYAGYQAPSGRCTYRKTGEGQWYIDAGNGEHSGQVLIGNAWARELQKSFRPHRDVYPPDYKQAFEDGICERLPLPTVQQPALLAPAPEPVRRLDCAEAVIANGQSPVINQAMAALVLQFVYRLMRGELTWMAAYLDLENGTMSTVNADPEIVSRISGLSVKQLVTRAR